MEVVEDGQKALTEIKVLDNTGKKFALVEAHPLTGRTHQIRAHLEAIGTPIVGDDKYFGEKRERFQQIQDKLYLHAYKIDLSDIYNKKTVITADLPKHFVEACQFFGLEIK
jgi:23S rRNA pseudouridine955/2504/2580 synthase